MSSETKTLSEEISTLTDKLSREAKDALKRAWTAGWEVGYKEARRQFEYPRDAIDM
jgi:hypothetical protein